MSAICFHKIQREELARLLVSVVYVWNLPPQCAEQDANCERSHTYKNILIEVESAVYSG